MSSKVIDQKVVEMRFDNQNFEKNVNQSINTLDKLNQKLKLDEGTKGLNTIDTKVNGMKFDKLITAIDSINDRFSGLSLIVKRFTWDFAGFLENYGLNLAKTLSVDGIASGWQKLSDKATSMSTLISQGYDTEVVEKQLEKLNWFSDETSYNFTDMINNISKFTATGQKLDSSVTAMEGIALWAAKSGQNAQKASAAMYQLSQALGAGVMRKEDWKSIQNYSMDTQEFRKQAIQAAIDLGTLKKTGDETYKSLVGNKAEFKLSQFADNLTEGAWFTSDVMMKVYQNYAIGAEQIKQAIDKMSDTHNIELIASDIIDAYKAYNNLNKSGETFADFLEENEITGEAAIELEKMIKSMDKFGMSAMMAGQEYRTWQDVVDATKDAVGTKWMSVFETILGNIDQQKELWSMVGEKFYSWFAEPVENLNKMLKKWVKLGGRDSLGGALSNIGTAISKIVAPIKEAWKSIFPPMTANRLAELTSKFKDFTSKLIIGEKTGNAINSIFKAFFSILKIGITVVKTIASALFKLLGVFKPLGELLADGVNFLGKWIDKAATAARNSTWLSEALDKVVGAVKRFVESISAFFRKILSFESLINFFKSVFNLVKMVGYAIGKFIGGLVHSGDLNQLIKLVNSGLFSAALIKLGKMIDSVKDAFKGAKGFIDSFKKSTIGFLDQFRSILEEYQKSIRAKSIKQIAIAALMLVGALWVLSGINSDDLGKAITAMAAAMAELLVAFKVLTKFTVDADNIGKGSRALVKFALSMLILSVAIEKLSSIKLDEMAIALGGLGLSLQIFIHAFKRIPASKNNKKKAAGLIGMSVAILILATALKKLGNLSVEQIIKSLITMFVSLEILTKTINKIKPKGAIGKAFSMVLLANAMIVLGLALKLLATMSWSDIGRALTVMAGALAILVIAMNALDSGNKKASRVIGPNGYKSTKSGSGSAIAKSFALLGATFAMIQLGAALKILATMSWSDIGRALTVMAGSLVLLVAAIKILGSSVGGSLAGAGSLLIVANAMIILGLALKLLATMSWGSIVKSLTALAGALTVLGVAAFSFKALAIDKTLLVIAGAFALFGVATVAIGAGLLLIAGGITALAIALSGGTTAIVAGISAIIIGVLGLVPEIVKAIGLAISELCKVIIECAPQIAQALGTVLLEAVKMLKDFVPPIVTNILDLVIKTIRAVADRVPELIVAIAELLSAIFKGFMEAFKVLDPEILVGAIACLGMLAVIFHLLAGLALSAPMAMVGVIAFGVLLTELIGVLAIISAFLGTADAIYAAGEVLQAVGTAIGQFIGGIVGGIAKGVSDSMPDIATNLSIFMKNIEGFVEGLKKVDPFIIFGATSLAAAIIELSAANLVVGIVDLLSLGQHDLVTLGKELSGFMTELKPFLDGIRLVNPTIVQSVTYLAEAILILTAANLLAGLGRLFSFIFGGNSLTAFASELPLLGAGLAGFAKQVSSMNNTDAVESAAKSIVSLAKAAQEIPNEGGLWAKIFGDNSIGKWSGYLPTLGTNLSQFATNLGSFRNSESITAAGQAVVSLATAAKEIPNEGGLWAKIFGDNSIGDFADKLPGVATHLKDMAENLEGFSPEDADACGRAGDAIAALAKAADEIPNSFGLVNLFTGDNDIAIFAWKLPTVGTHLKSFVKNLGTFDSGAADKSKWAGEAIKNLAIAASEIPNEGGLAEFFEGDNDIANFAPKLPAVATHLTKFVENLGTFETDQVKTVECAGRALLALSESASNVPASGGVAQWFTGENDFGKFSEDFPKVGKALVSFVNSLTDNGSKTFTDAEVATIDCAGRAISALAKAADDIPASGGIWQKLVGEKDLGDFAEDFPKVGKGIIAFVNAITNNGSSTFSNDQVSTVECASKALKALADAAKSLPETGGFLSIFTGDEEDLEDFAEQFPCVAEGLRAFMDELGTFSDKEVKSMEHATAAIKLMSDMYKVDWDELEDMSDDAEDVGENMGDFVTQLAKIDTSKADDAQYNANVIADVINTFSEQINGDNFHHISEGFINFGKDFISSFVESISGTDPKTKIVNAAQDLLTKLKEALEAERTYVEEKFTSLINGSIDKLTDSGYVDKMKEAGKYAAQGFADGIEENAYLATTAGTNLGKYAYDAAKKAIDAHSPSKKTMELGNYFGLGFIKGIEDYNNEVYNEAENMGDLASKGLTKAISTVNDIFNNEGTNRPVISPVLDLSDVENQASTLDNLFNNVRLGTNLNAISSGMRQRSQNGTNNDIVSAINKLGSNLGNTTGDTYNINGITYDDSSGISDAVRTLIRAANIERRS